MTPIVLKNMCWLKAKVNLEDRRMPVIFKTGDRPLQVEAGA
jgi:hypothetical protein